MLVAAMILNSIDILMFFLLCRTITRNYATFTVKRVLFGISYGIVFGSVAYLFDGGYPHRIIVTMVMFFMIQIMTKRGFSSVFLIYSFAWIIGLINQFLFFFMMQFMELTLAPMLLIAQTLTLLTVALICKFLPLNKWFRFVEEHLELKLAILLTAFVTVGFAFYWNLEFSWVYLLYFLILFAATLMAIYSVGTKIVYLRHKVPQAEHDTYHADLGMFLTAYKNSNQEMINDLANIHQDELFKQLTKQLQLGKVTENIITFIEAKQKIHNSAIEIQHEINYIADRQTVGVDVIIKLLSILLDNALESGTRKPIIVELSVAFGFIHLCVRNEFKRQKEDPEELNRMLTIDGYTTKKIQHRGYGLTSLHTDVERLGGEILVSYTYNDAGETSYLNVKVSL